MIDVAALHALRTVAALGTLARAAEELGYTASAVSQQIKRLERQVGVDVISPAGRGVVLTPAGQAIVNAAPEVFQALERCTQAAQSVADGTPRGTLRIAAFSTAIRGMVAPALGRMHLEFPDLRVLVTEQDPDRALHSVDSGSADVALVHDADGLPVSVPANLNQRALHVDIGDIVMHREHPLAKHTAPLRGTHLSGHAWVTSPPGTVCHQWFRRLVADLDEAPDVRHLVDDFASQLSLVASTGVVALIPRLARPPLGSDLVAVPLHRPPTREVHVAWRRSADASPSIRALVTELSKAHLAPRDRDSRL
ncbi:LysR family transcriptional regulator [Rhodococcus sp. G-MC3]|uniref:LysR family transcriptional regulator n=1 Tax=Rhodococcus sp. G-MC3 TaxID=3046209 RepID=UPI0024B8EE6C|nr:LysR family transcriptional regulator [Rhodococcus sp. G-MC3]MDJ0394811.1 LysR family transcriptional regulator [Rhodococcus sp. G-MC3]